MDKVYVVIVTFNAASWLQTCLRGLESSTVHVTPIVVDNNSNDATLQLLAEHYPHVTVISNKHNAGFGQANNQGIALALGAGADYIFLQNQDAHVFPETIETLVAISKRHPDYYVLSPLHYEGSGKKLDNNFARWIAAGNTYSWLNGVEADTKNAEEIYPARFINAALWLLPAAALRTVGGFDPLFFHYGEDIDYTNRVRYHGFKVGVCPGAAAIHDRMQERIPAQQSNKPRDTAYLIILKNINRSTGVSLALFLKKFLHIQLQNIKQKQWRSIPADTGCFFKTLFKLPTILQHRNLSKKTSSPFISQQVKKSSTAIVTTPQPSYHHT